MGRKQTRARKFVYLYIAGLIFFVLSGCAVLKEKERVEVEVKVKKEEPLKKVEVEVKKEEPPKKEDSLEILSGHLLRGKALLEQLDYDGSLKESQKVLSLSGKNPPGDEALFNMGLIFAHPGNPKKDYGKSLSFLKKLTQDYPQSPLVEQAKIWKGILEENEKLSKSIEKLNEMVEELKRVDIEIEGKKKEKGK